MRFVVIFNHLKMFQISSYVIKWAKLLFYFEMGILYANLCVPSNEENFLKWLMCSFI